MSPADRETASVIGKQLAEGVYFDKDSLDGGFMVAGGITGRAGAGGDTIGLSLGDLTFWHCWARCPIIVMLASGQYLTTLE